MTRRKDGRWQAVLVIDGKRRYFCGKTQKEVVQKIAAYQEKKEKARLFGAIAGEWREEHYAEIEPSSARGYDPSYNRAVAEFGDTPIDAIEPRDISALLADMKRQKYGKKTVATQRDVLGMIFSFAVRNGIIDNNPCACVPLPKNLPSYPRKLPTKTDIEAVENSEWLFPFFLAYTGMRRGEALAIRYEDIDREKKIITVSRAVGYVGHIPYIKTPKTTAGARTIVLLDKLLARIPNKRSGLVFANESGEIYTDVQIFREWQRWQKENNTTVTAHQLRHYYATLLFEAEISVKDAQSLLGHSSAKITQDIYTHIREQRISQTAEKLNAYVSSMAK